MHDEAEQPERRDLLARSYQELLGANLTTLVREAALAPPLANEIGMLRVALARLLVEEGDIGRLAANIAKVGAVAVQAARVRGALDARAATEPGEDEAAAVRATLLLLGKGPPALEEDAEQGDDGEHE